MDEQTQELRARVPPNVDSARPSRTFSPGAWIEANAWLDAMLAPAPAVPPGLTLEEWAHEWWKAYVEAIRPENTAGAYLSYLRHLEPRYATPLTDVTTVDLQRIVGAVAKRVAPATVRAMVGVWRRMFDAALEDGHITRNPARKLVYATVPRKPPARHLTAQEASMLRAAMIGHRFEPVYAIMIGCGLRIGEILGLAWEHVDLAGRRLWIERQFTNAHWRDAPKGLNPHWVPLPAWVADILGRHRKTQPVAWTLVMQTPHRRRRTRQPDTPKPWSRQAVAADLTKLIAALGLDHATPHAGRHGLATYLLQGGVAPPVIAERLGNSAAIVLSTYGHATQEGRDRADKLVEEYLAQQPPEDDSGEKSG